ncbi:Protein phosphatase 1 regulatory subunit 12C [Takifugu flavidus]|uniref:Protein phosphatase 1 regulatory subunit 12C n=1 Tax=Takifugu flavidus TaxID=433684 RepID=A0A5C6MYM8_9TELE|nr:Protein phosphatase 1 regulatory subunit 12C [Takifugu flavidus]
MLMVLVLFSRMKLRRVRWTTPMGTSTGRTNWETGQLTTERWLYFRLLQDNLELKEKLQEMELLLSQNKVELERLRQSQEGDRPALMELGKFSDPFCPLLSSDPSVARTVINSCDSSQEKLSLQRRAVELEDELKVLGDLRSDNQRLKDENAALIRVISKLSR